MVSPALCLAHLSLIELAPPALVDVAADAGFASVSLRLGAASPGGIAYPMAADSPPMRETLARLRDRDVGVNDVELVGLTVHTDVPALEPLVAATAALGARHLLVAGDDGDEAAMAAQFRALCELGARYQLRMGLEFMPWRGIASLASARRVVQAAGMGGVIVDALHLDRSGGTAQQLAELPPSQWAWFQICDAPAQRPATQEELLFQARQARLPPGQGGLDLVAMLRACPAETVVSVEAPLHGRPDLLPPLERARLLREATLRVLAQADAHA